MCNHPTAQKKENRNSISKQNAHPDSLREGAKVSDAGQRLSVCFSPSSSATLKNALHCEEFTSLPSCSLAPFQPLTCHPDGGDAFHTGTGHRADAFPYVIKRTQRVKPPRTEALLSAWERWCHWVQQLGFSLNHGCRTQQHRIHEKESREAVSDPEQRRVWFHSCWGDSGWLVGNSLRGSDGEDSLLADYKLFVQLSCWFHMRGGSKFCPCALQKASLHLPSVSCLKGKKNTLA